MTIAPKTPEQSATAKAEPVVVRRSLASFDLELPDECSLLCKAHQTGDGKWKWWIFDVNSKLAMAETHGFGDTEDEAKRNCGKSLAKIVRLKADRINNIADRLNEGDESLEWN